KACADQEFALPPPIALGMGGGFADRSGVERLGGESRCGRASAARSSRAGAIVAEGGPAVAVAVRWYLGTPVEYVIDQHVRPGEPIPERAKS
ncbi:MULTISPECIES: hypothetical protein, partial [unclassified Microbispora]|uniref:hypothetical protein n=1 Tax=unclassified Microbispora TaxID=2614687 RepID=UPI00197C0226